MCAIQVVACTHEFQGIIRVASSKALGNSKLVNIEVNPPTSTEPPMFQLTIHMVNDAGDGCDVEPSEKIFSLIS